MRIVLAMIAFFTILVVTSMAWEMYNPHPVAAVDPVAAAERHRQDEEVRKATIVKKAYEECRESKVSNGAILRCVRDKIS